MPGRGGFLSSLPHQTFPDELSNPNKIPLTISEKPSYRDLAEQEASTNVVTYLSSTPTRDYSHISWIFLGDLTLNQRGQEFMSGEEP
jgi:hypothetical protein